MKIVIGIVIVIIILIISGLIFRKKLYDKIDYYEAWKLDIMNRNILTEINQLKKLNLEGDAKERYEFFKNEWQHIIERDAADLEELLYDTEKAADVYNFPKANKLMQRLDASMVSIENRIENITNELTELLEIDERNNEKRNEFDPRLAKLQSYIIEKHDLFYLVTSKWEKQIENIHNQLIQYDAYIEEGSYKKGAELIKELDEQLITLEEDVAAYPEMYEKLKKEYPKELKKLQSGILEMESAGYVMADNHLKEELSSYFTRLDDLLKLLVKDGAEPVQNELAKIDERISEIYDLLEVEVLAKNYLDSKLPHLSQKLEQFIQAFKNTNDYVESLKEKYYFNDSELENFMEIEKQYESLNNQYLVLKEETTNRKLAYSNLRSKLEQQMEALGKLEEAHNAFKERTENLKDDELGAHDKVLFYQEALSKMVRRLKHSHLPGIPNSIWQLVDVLEDKTEQLEETLGRRPVDIADVENNLNIANDAYETLHQKTEEIFEQAFLIERIIQYANRYRSRHPELAKQLSEAEEQFRDAEYKLSLETAATALETIDPNALKEVENLQRKTRQR